MVTFILVQLTVHAHRPFLHNTHFVRVAILGEPLAVDPSYADKEEFFWSDSNTASLNDVSYADSSTLQLAQLCLQWGFCRQSYVGEAVWYFPPARLTNNNYANTTQHVVLIWCF